MPETKSPKQANREGSPSQIDLMTAMVEALKEDGFPEANQRQLNAIIEASNLVVDAFAKPDRPSVPGSGLAVWIASDDTGLSSRTMARTLAPLIGQNGPMGEKFGYGNINEPADPSDFGRCVRLLGAVPELREHLPKMAEVSAGWAALVAAWDELEALYVEEFPTGYAPKLWDRIKAILDGVAEQRKGAKF